MNAWHYIPSLYVVAVVLTLWAWRDRRRELRERRDALGDGDIMTEEDIQREIG